MSPYSPSGWAICGISPQISGAVIHWIGRGVGEARESPSANSSSESAAAALHTTITQYQILFFLMDSSIG